MRPGTGVVGGQGERDPRPARWRVGLIVLATDHTTERDFTAMSPTGELAVYANRVVFANPVTEENLRAMGPLLSEAAGRILPGETLDAVAYSCTAASVLIGDEAVRDAVGTSKPGVPVVTPTSATLEAFKVLGVRRISVLTPYVPSLTDALVDHLEASGLEVLNAACLGLTDDREIACVAPACILSAAVETFRAPSEGLFISCTALRAVVASQAIEDRLRAPVVTSNQAMFWRALRQVGCDLRCHGFGRLLSLH